MPAFTRADALSFNQRTVLPGIKIYVSLATGNDTTGDGSISAPYLTIGRAALDLRDGRNDTIVLIGSGLSAEPPVVISGRDGVAVVALGVGNIIRPPTGGRRSVNVISAWSIVSSQVSMTTTAGHGILVGDYVMIHAAAFSGGARPRGLARVTNSTATEIRAEFRTVIAGQQPITGGNQGWFSPVPLVFEDCTRVTVSGLTFAPPPFTDAMSALGFSARSAGAPDMNDILMTGCRFLNSAIGFAGFDPSATLGFNGGNIFIERNSFLSNTFGLGGPRVYEAGLLYFDAGDNIEVSENIFQRSDLTAAASGSDGFINLDRSPRTSLLFTNNRVDGNPVAGQGIPLSGLFVTQNPNLERVFVEQNVFTHPGIGAEFIAVDATGALRERNPTRFLGADRIESPIDQIRNVIGALASLRVTGGTASSVQTNATQADGFFDGTRIVVRSSTEAAFGLTHEYLQANGTFNLERPLPFTPAAGDAFLVLGTGDVHSLLDHDLAAHTTLGSVGEALNNADVPTSTRAAPGDAMDLVTDALDAAAVAASGAQEIAAEVETDLSATHGAGSWATATGFATPGDVTTSETAILAAIAALTDLSIADVQTALTAQGYTSARSALLDFLDAGVSTRATPADVDSAETAILAAIAALVDLDIADVQNALTAQGYTSARSALLDLLDVPVSRGLDRNAESIAFFADANISSTRFVPQGAISHLRVRVKADAAADWSAPVDTYFVVFSYLPGASATDRAASANTAATAPVDGTFTSTTAP